jgi:hypothetical protein
MINRERVALIPAALRAVKEDGTPVYLKGRLFLHRIRGGVSTWCCLGAASQEACANGLEIARTVIEHRDGYITEKFASQSSEVMCLQVMDWYGFDDLDPKLTTADGRRSVPASVWNDYGPDKGGAEPDFGTIADAFERTFLS